MSQLNNLLAKFGIAGVSSVAVVESANLDSIWNALITLALSIISVLAVEGVNWLRKTISSHTPKTDEDKEKDKKENKEEE